MAWNVKIIGAYKPRIYYQIVKWKLPKEDQLNWNINSASKVYTGEGVYGFFIRNKTGDFIYAQADKIGITMNIEAETRAVQKA